MSLGFVAFNIIRITLNFIHNSFYYSYTRSNPLRIGFVLLLLYAPWLLLLVVPFAITDVRWMVLIVASSCYSSLVLRKFLFVGSYTRILYGVFAVGSFSNIYQIIVHIVTYHSLDLPLAGYVYDSAGAAQILPNLVMLPLLYRYARKPAAIILDSVERSTWYFVMIVPLILFLLGFATVQVIHHYAGGLTSALGLLAIATVIAFYWSRYSIIVQERRNRYLSDQLNAFHRIMAHYTRYNLELEKKENQLRMLRHDLRHIMGALTHAARQGDYAVIEDLAGKISAVDEETRITVDSGNRTVNAIVSFHFSLAQAHGVACEAKLAIPTPINLSDAELALLFGNALDNSVKATTPLKERGIIKVTGKMVNDCLVLKFSNNFQPDTMTAGDGLGLGSMRILCEKYNGSFECDVVDGEFLVTAVIQPNSHVKSKHGGLARRTVE